MTSLSQARKDGASSWGLEDPRKYIDFLYLCLAFLAAYSLRFDFIWPAESLGKILVQLPLTVFTQLVFLHFFGGYKLLWRLFTIQDLKLFAKAAGASFTAIALLRLLLPDALAAWRVPFAVSVHATLLGFGGLMGLRLLRRTLHERAARRIHPLRPGRNLKPVLLIGAGHAGVLAVKELQARPGMSIEIKGFVDDDVKKVGRVIQGVAVLGTTDSLPRLVPELGIDHVIVTIARISRFNLDRIVQRCNQVPVRARIIPGLHELLCGQVEVSSIRDVHIEDLLGREPVELDEALIGRFLAGRTVLVTGAGGSIGSELARQAARFGARPLLLVERSEGALFEIERDLLSRKPGGELVPLVADIADRSRMQKIFERYRPQVLVHAAAHKHVPLMEQNPLEAVKNNVLATRMLAEMSIEHGLDCFLQISTDKAVRPTSVMGATKRMAELAVQSLRGLSPTRFVSVRFGNVLGSAGSVIPIFQKQILDGGPVTVTHPDMVRYFMTIPEATQLTLQAGAMGEGGEIFVLDMGAPVKIVDLARQMIRLMGLRPEADIQIVFTGTRPGEKLFEELGSESEALTRTRNPKIFIGHIQSYPEEQVAAGLERLRALAIEGDEQELRHFFNQTLPEARIGVVPTLTT